MFKKILLATSAIIAALGSTIISTPAVFACDYLCSEGQIDCENPCPDGVMPINDTDDGTIDEPTAPSTDGGETVHPEAEQPETDGSTETTDEEESDEPEAWPMYLSLGALAGTLILIIIINLTLGRRKK